MKLAFIFPGQGSQYVGMGTELLSYPEARRVFEEADESLGFSLSDIIRQGPESTLRETPITQPAVLTVSTAFLGLLRSQGVVPAVCAGHSLGEYSALVAADSLNFSDAVNLVHQRGKIMQEESPGGSMLAVIGMKKDELLKLCHETDTEAANFNSPGQVVVAGMKPNLDAFIERASARGAKRVVPLPVSGPFHSSHLRGAAEKLKGLLEDIEIRDPSVPVVANSDYQLLKSAEQVRAELVRQVYSPVCWEDSIRAMIDMGVSQFIEVGPGKVLSGLVRRIDKAAQVLATDGDFDQIAALAGEVNK